MSGKYSTVAVSLLAGVLGGGISRLIFPTPPSVLAQDAAAKILDKYQEKSVSVSNAKVLRAERLELINKQGKVLAVLEIGYSEALPAGAPRLTLTANDEFLHQEEKLVLSTTGLNTRIGENDSIIVGPGQGIMFRDSRGGGMLGLIPTFRGTMGHGLSIYSPEGTAFFDTQRLNFANKDGIPRLTIP